MRLRLSEAQPKISQPTLRMVIETNKIVSDVKLNDTHFTICPCTRQLKWNDLAVVGYTDAAQGDRVDGSSTGCFVLTVAPYRQSIQNHMTDMSFMGWSTKKKLKRVARSSLSAEIQQACNSDHELFATRLFWSEFNGCQVTKRNVTDAVKATPGLIVLDAKGVYDAFQNSSSTALYLTEKTKWKRAAGTERQCRRARHGSSTVSHRHSVG